MSLSDVKLPLDQRASHSGLYRSGFVNIGGESEVSQDALRFEYFSYFGDASVLGGVGVDAPGENKVEEAILALLLFALKDETYVNYLKGIIEEIEQEGSDNEEDYKQAFLDKVNGV